MELIPSRDATSDVQDRIEDAPCGLLQTTPEGDFLRTNRTFCKWIGRNPEELVARLRLQDLMTASSRVFFHTHCIPLLQAQGSVSEMRIGLTSADGRILPVVLNVVRRMIRGAVVHEIAAFVAPARERYERELASSHQRLEKLVAEATSLRAEATERGALANQLLGILTHDLPEPISSILRGAALLESETLSEAQREMLSTISVAAERANRRLRDLQKVTQIRSGAGLVIAPQTVDLHAVTDGELAQLAHDHPRRVLRHETEGPGEFVTDPALLALAVNHLVSNALQYGDAAEDVVVRTHVRAEAAYVEVQNSGEPFGPEGAAALSQPSVQANPSKDARPLAGLGLFIVSEIARAHGGTIGALALPKGRTTLTMFLPRSGPTDKPWRDW